MKKNLFFLVLIISVAFTACGKLDSQKMFGKVHQPAELIEDPDVALQMLKDGNTRYLKGALLDKGSYDKDRVVLDTGQKPFAVVVTCSDSRVAPEIYFDQKLGDIFAVRNAGNVADTTALGSLEYAVEHLKTKLVVVVGHTKCGAVSAAHAGGHLPPNIQHIIDHIKPAVAKGGDVDQVVKHNVEIMVQKIKANEIVKHEHAKVVGAVYNINTGDVTWL